MSRVRSFAIGALVGAILALAGCSPTAAYVTAVKIKGVAAQTTLDSYEAWRQFDVKHQQDLLATSPSVDAFVSEVKAWRTGVQKPVDDAFATLRDAVNTYSIALDASSATKAKDFSGAVAKLIAAVEQVVSTLKRYNVNVPMPGVQ